MSDTTVKTRTADWEQICAEANGPTVKEVAYEFSNGKQFKEPFHPDGTGIYEDDA